MGRAALLAMMIAAASPAVADAPRVVEVRVSAEGGGTYRFDVTVVHADTGWEHYADAFVVTAPDGTVLGTRVLYHPHVNEQPFTRSLSGVTVPAGLTTVQVHANDNVHGAGPSTSVTLPR